MFYHYFFDQYSRQDEKIVRNQSFLLLPFPFCLLVLLVQCLFASYNLLCMSYFKYYSFFVQRSLSLVLNFDMDVWNALDKSKCNELEKHANTNKISPLSSSIDFISTSQEHTSKLRSRV